jgi:hypothetical protein
MHPSLAFTPSEDKIAFVTPYALNSDWYRVILFPIVKLPVFGIDDDGLNYILSIGNVTALMSDSGIE